MGGGEKGAAPQLCHPEEQQVSRRIARQLPCSLLHPRNGSHPDGDMRCPRACRARLEPWHCAEGQGCPSAPATPATLPFTRLSPHPLPG